jgi:hypothetical protein
LEHQLGKKKKGGSVDPVIEAQREGKLFTWDGKLLKCSFQSQGNVLSPCLNKMRWGGDDPDHSSDDQMQGTRSCKRLCTPLDDDEEELGCIIQDKLELEENGDDECDGESLIHDVDLTMTSYRYRWARQLA